MSDSRSEPRSCTPRPWLFATAIAVAVLLSCSPSDAAHGNPSRDGTASQSAQSVEADILDLITAVTPLAPTMPPGELSAWFGRRHDTLERLRSAGHEHGLEALRQYQARKDTLAEIRCGLLDIAAHAATEETRPVLALLVTEYGDHMLVRTKAAELLGATSPEHALDIIGPILRHEKTGRTYPREEHLLRAWYQACATLDRDPVGLICMIAVDLPREMDVRHLATKLLGEFKSNQGRQALEQLLTESTGNHMLRRFASQSLRASLSAEEFCALLRPIRANEADPNFQIFLDNMLLASCR